MNAPDPVDLSDDLSRLRSTLDRVDGLHRRLVDEYKVGTGDSPTRSLLLRDLDNAFGDAAKLAAIDRPVFIEAYTRFSGAVEALDRTVARIEQRLPEGQHDPHDPLARTAVRLLDEAALELELELQRLRQTASVTLARHQSETVANEFNAELVSLASRVRAVASESGLDIEHSDWGRHAAQEAESADRWRRAAITSLALTIASSVAGFVHAVGAADEDWSGAALKATVVASMGALSAYCASQSAEHRRASREAHRNALDLATFNLLAEQMAPEARQDLLRAVAAQRFIGGRQTEEPPTAEPATSLVEAIARALRAN